MEKCWNFIFRQDVVSGKGATGIAHQDFLFKKISKWNRNVVNIFNTISKKKLGRDEDFSSEMLRRTTRRRLAAQLLPCRGKLSHTHRPTAAASANDPSDH
jgi:hypothetical protein